MISTSTSGLLTIVFFGSVLILAFGLFMQKTEWIAYIGSRAVIWTLLIVMARLLIPFELGFERSVYLDDLLPAVRDFLLLPLPIGSVTVTPGMILLGVWITGALVHLARIVISWRVFIRKVCEAKLPCPPRAREAFEKLRRERGKKMKRVELLCSSTIRTPMLVGLVRPRILIPPIDFSKTRWEMVFRHELFHYEHHDLWIKCFCEVLCGVYWWNPATKSLRENLSKALEIHNDEVITEDMREMQRICYLECLTQTARGSAKSLPPSYVMAFSTLGNSPLAQRIFLICTMDPERRRKQKRRFIPVLLCMLAVVTLCFSVVFEPLYDAPEQFINFNSENTYIVQNENGQYDIYIDDNFLVTVQSIEKSFIDLPIYNSLDEVDER